jgi:riboflavin synthase
MFTGIVEELGAVRALEPSGDGARLSVEGKVVTADAGDGDSIAVNGVCLTVVDVDGETFTADVMKVTLDRTNLGALSPGAVVNLERAVTPQTRLGGHLVQGHVDDTVEVLSRTPGEAWEVVRFTLPAAIERYVVDRGSVCVDGTSLTVSAVGDGWFEVSLIPTTLDRTTLGLVAPGDRVNVEVDVIAKYVERLTGRAG